MEMSVVAGYHYNYIYYGSCKTTVLHTPQQSSMKVLGSTLCATDFLA